MKLKNMQLNNRIQVRLKVIMVLTVIVFQVSLYSQETATNDLLIGTWTFLVAPSIDKMASDIKQDYATSVDLQNHVASFYSGRQLTFTSDNHFIILLATGQSLGGQWSIQNNVLTMLDNNGGTTSCQIGGINNSNLLLLAAPDSDPNQRILFPEMYFFKI